LFVNVSVAVINDTVPVRFGKVIVLSAVGSVIAKVVSKLSAVLPSNTRVPVTEAVPVIVGLVSDGVLNKFATVISFNAFTFASLMMKLSSVAGAAPRSLAFDIVFILNADTSLSISLIAPTIDVASIVELRVAKSPISVADKVLKVVLNVSNVSVDATLLAVILLLYYLF
jgi:hypothetical protein